MERKLTSLWRSGVIVIAIVVAILNWPDIAQIHPTGPRPSAIDQIVLSPPVLISFRLGAILLVAYLATSILALSLEGRWLVRVGSRGVETDTLETDRLINSNVQLEHRIEHVEASIEDLWLALEEFDLEEGGLE